jgi:hypothetical protein
MPNVKSDFGNPVPRQTPAKSDNAHANESTRDEVIARIGQAVYQETAKTK